MTAQEHERLPAALQELADALLISHDTARPIAPGARLPDLSLDDAQRVQDAIVAQRVARGEHRVGMKIGFTNRTIWKLYGVHHPIWGPVYDSSVSFLDAPSATVDCAQFCEPRLEPEIVLHLESVPCGPSPEAIVAAIDWIAHGFEIVQSAFPGWRFTGAESFAAQGLHGALLIGPRFQPAELLADRDHDLATRLSRMEIALYANDQLVKRGRGANVLDGPVQALGHLIAELARRGRTLSAGDVITTGTLTDGHPIAPDQLWETRLQGIALPGLQLRTR